MSLSDQLWCPTSVQVTVLQARGLRIKGKSGTNDAYAVMQVGKDKFQTSVAEKSVAPVWKEEASFDMPSAQQRGTLHVHVLHRALVGPDKLLGQAVINLLPLSEDHSRDKTQWFKLLDKAGKPDKDRGEVLLDIQFIRNNMTASMFDISAAGKSQSRLSKFKVKVTGKKKKGLSETTSNVVPDFSQVLTDSEGEGNSDGEGAAAKNEKKKNKVKSLFSHKSNLHKSLSQSMSVLPGKNSSLSGSMSSGLNVESTEGKKKFKFLGHKRSGSSDKKNGGLQKLEQSNLCINGSHVYCDEPAPRTSRTSSNFSISSSGVGSMTDDVPDGSPPSVGSMYSARHNSPWTEEEEEEEETIEESTKEMDEEMFRRRELERLAEEESRVEEEERRAEEEERLQKEMEEKQAAEMLRVEEERKRREEEEERRRLEEEEKRRHEKELRLQKEMEEKQAAEMLRRVEEERKRREEEEERRRLEEEEKKRLERELRLEEERLQKEMEEKQAAEMLRVEEEERKRHEEEEERRRLEEEEQLRRQEEEERRRLEEEEEWRREEERRRLEKELRLEQERLQREMEEKQAAEMLRVEEEERKRREEEEERRRLEEEEQWRREEEERQERERKEKERIWLEEQERCEEQRRKEQEDEERRQRAEEARRLLEEEKKKREELERLRKEEEEERLRLEMDRAEERRIEEERKAQEEEKRRREREEEERKEKERLMEEERRQRELEEEQERVRKVEKERREVEMKRAEEERRQRELEEEQERIRKEEEEKIREAERAEEEKGQRRRLEEEERVMMEEAQRPSKTTSETQDVTNPFDEEFEDNVPESTARVTSARQRCKLPLERSTCSFNEKDLSAAQQEKRQAPKPPRMTSSESQQVSQREVKLNKPSKDKEIKTASVLPQRAVKKMPPVGTPASDLNKSEQPEHAPRVAASRRKQAPQRPDEESLSSKADMSHGPAPKSGQAPAGHSLNPFEEDEDIDELTDQHTTTTAASSVEKHTSSQVKIKSSKTAHAPVPPTKKPHTSSPDRGHDTDVFRSDINEDKTTAPVQKELHKESKCEQDEVVKKDAPPVPSRRLQPVRPLNPLDQQPVSAVQEIERDNKFTGEIIRSEERKAKVSASGPYALLTQEELISLVLKQEKQLSEKNKKITELEQYIDNLLVRVIEEAPDVLMSMAALK